MRVTAFADELLALRHAELVLLINDDEAEVVGSKAGLNQSVRANRQKRGARSAERGIGRAVFFHVRCSMFDVRCSPAAGPQFHADSQRPEPTVERLKMLFRQNFRRRHQRDMVTAFQSHQRGAGGHGGLARANIALQQTAHRRLAAQVATDFAQHFGLGAGEGEAEPPEKRFDDMIVAAARQAARIRLKIRATTLNLQLQFEEFVESEFLPRDFDVGHRLREMKHTNRVGARLVPLKGHLRFELLERPPNEGPQPPLRQAFGQRINGREAIDVNEVFVARFDNLRFGMVHGARPERNRLAIDEHFVARLKIFLHERQVPPAAVQPRRAVVEDEFEHRFAAAAPAFDAARDDFAARGGCLVQSQPGNGADMPAVFIAPRPVKQQIEDGIES